MIASHVSADPAPDVLEASQEQLGPRLMRKKRVVDVVVIDHIERTPTEN